MANKRFEMHDIRNILVRMRLGDSDRQVRDAGLCGRKKASRLRVVAQKNGWLDPTWPLPDNAVITPDLVKKPFRESNQSPLVSLVETIRPWAEQKIQGTVIHRKLVESHGYKGSYSSVIRLIQKLEPTFKNATIMLDFNPGEAGQVDFGKGPIVIDRMTGEVVSTWFFVMTLAFSRHQYVEFVKNQKVETWLACHRRAFEFFGGVPEKIILDNAKCAIIKACNHDPQVQRSYYEFAEGYGFKIAPCPPRDPKKKGRVESGVKYVKKNFIPLRAFSSMTDINNQAMDWIMQTAGLRDHGTTKQKPLDLFATEKSFFKKLPDVPMELAVWLKLRVQNNCHVQVYKCYYSVPYKHVHEQVWIRVTASSVQVYLDHAMIAVHVRKLKDGERSTLRDHMPPQAVAYLMRDPTWCRAKAEQIGPSCLQVIERLFGDRVIERLPSAQGVLRFAEKYNPARLEAACRRVLTYDAQPGYRKIKTILELNLDLTKEEPEQTTLFSSVYQGGGKFCRDSRTLLQTTTNIPEMSE